MTTTLTKQEKNNVQKALGNMASSLNQTVAKLYLSNPQDGQWTDTGVWGAVVICIDRTPPKSNFIKIFDLNTFTVRFSQELYENMSYQQAHQRFHTFEIDNAVVGLSFVDGEEAEGFLGAVRRMIPVPGMSTATAGSAVANSRKKSTKGGFLSRLFGGKKDAHAEIGLPTNFVHKSHIGYDVEKGFESTDLPPEWKNIMKNAGIKKRDLKNPETAKIIYDTLQEEFGANPYGALPVDTSGAVTVPHHPYGFTAPQPASPTPPTPPPARALPPTPTPPAATPPPQAPPMAPPMAPPIAPSPTAPAAPTPDAPPPMAPELSPSTENKANVSDLHSAIRGGISLRKVAKPNKNDALPDVSQLNQQETTTLTSVLQIAMMKRLKSLQGGGRGSVSEMMSTSEVNVQDDEDEWSDS